MANAIPMLRREQRRHLLMNGWLIAGFIVVGTAVTNERGIFRPLDLENAMSATARAFVAIASPIGPRLRDIRSVSSLNPFETPSPTRDLRRRLIDAIDWLPGDDPLPREALTLASAAPDSFTQPSDALLAGDGQPPAFTSTPNQIGIDNPTTVPPASIDNNTPTGVVPEPATWAMLILGFGVIGSVIRRAGALRRPAATRRRRRRIAVA